MIASQATNYTVTYGAFKMTLAVSWFLAKLMMFLSVAYFLNFPISETWYKNRF